MKKIFIPPVLVFLSLTLILIFYFLIPDFNLIPYPFNLSGILIVFVGFSIMGLSNRLFLKHKTTRSINKSSHLITEGIFSKSRNPMYLGMFLFLLGIGVCSMNLFSMFAPFGFLLIIRLVFIPTEEKMMYGTFGEEYTEYKKKVRRWV